MRTHENKDPTSDEDLLSLLKNVLGGLAIQTQRCRPEGLPKFPTALHPLNGEKKNQEDKTRHTKYSLFKSNVKERFLL